MQSQHQQQLLLPLVPLLLPNLVLLANGHNIFDRAINVRVGIATTLAWEGNIRVIRVSRKESLKLREVNFETAALTPARLSG